MVMQKETRTTTKRIGLLLAILSFSLSCLFAQPAQAIIRDQSVVGRLQDQRNVLILKERQLLEDYDDLQEQIRDMQKRDNDPKMVDQLCRQADSTFSDLKSVRYNLRQIEVLLM